jgi:hypothetical protein
MVPSFAKPVTNNTKTAETRVACDHFRQGTRLIGDLSTLVEPQSGTWGITVRTLPCFSQPSQHRPVIIATVLAISTPAMA